MKRVAFSLLLAVLAGATSGVVAQTTIEEARKQGTDLGKSMRADESLGPNDANLAFELNEMQPLLSSLLTPAGFGLELVLQAGVVEADIARIRQAVLALVDNARRYADPCILQIEVEYTGSTAAIMIADQGPGLPAGFEEDAFRQFARGNTRWGGSGLGLAVVRGIARAHGGDVTYQRSRGRFVFCVSLPRARSSEMSVV